MRKKSIAIAGIHVRVKHAHPLRERPNLRLRDLMNRKPHLPAPFHARVEDSLISYELENNIIHTDTEWILAPWQQLDDEILDMDMLQFSKRNATIIRQNYQQQMERYTEYEEVYTDGSKTDEGVGYSAIKTRLFNASLRICMMMVVHSKSFYTEAL
jgi:hypothetical protein